MPHPLRAACSILLIVVTFLASSGCGGGEDEAAAPPMPDRLPPPALDLPEVMEEAPPPPVSPPAAALDPLPIVNIRGRLHVGADVAADADRLSMVGTPDGVTVSYGRLRDGAGASEVTAYLTQHVSTGEFRSEPGLITFPAAPVVRLAESTPDDLAGFVVQAVRLINAALPHDRRLRFGSEPATPLQAIEDVPDGHIFVDFIPWRDWNDPLKPPEEEAVALAQSAWHAVFNTDAERWEGRRMRAGHIWVDRDAIHTAWVRAFGSGRWEERVLNRRVDNGPRVEKWYSDQAVVAILVHELLHTLGMSAHLDPDRFPRSVLNEDRHDYDGVTGHVIHPLDREALQAAYSVLEPGTHPEQLAHELGSWSDVSLHLRGDIGAPRPAAAFGVAVRNGLPQPWAYGRMPDSDLAENRGLSGTATWSGRLLGFTPALQAVGAAAHLSVDLSTLAGQLDFTALEHWPANAAPGPVGSGTRWRDGDLGYGLVILGNTFTQTGGDAGTVTGAFFGRAHDAVGGVLERDDLTAAFGGTR